MKLSKTSANKSGFTLIELLVVIAIIGLLSSVVLASLSNARASARDSQRVQSLRNLQTAVEMYYNDNGEYPTYSDSGSSGWRGGCTYGSYGYGSNGYIPDLVPEYISSLPEDSRCGETYNGSIGADFIYKSDGKDYIIQSHQSIETFDANEHELNKPGVDQQSIVVYSDWDLY